MPSRTELSSGEIFLFCEGISHAPQSRCLHCLSVYAVIFMDFWPDITHEGQEVIKDFIPVLLEVVLEDGHLLLGLLLHLTATTAVGPQCLQQRRWDTRGHQEDSVREPLNKQPPGLWESPSSLTRRQYFDGRQNNLWAKLCDKPGTPAELTAIHTVFQGLVHSLSKDWNQPKESTTTAPSTVCTLWSQLHIEAGIHIVQCPAGATVVLQTAKCMHEPQQLNWLH